MMKMRILSLVVFAIFALGSIPSPAWASASADSKPNTGRSLFDFLVTEKDANGTYVYKVPYPFEKLVEHIRKQANGIGKEEDNSINPTTLLIPNGRSLQRDTTNVTNPRGLVTFSAHPDVNSDISVVLKDRLFIGVSRKAHQLEVISYNEEAGRFEFQLVTDYKDGASPKVFYANRSFCTECHKAATPIFSRNPWDETNANIGVFSALKAENSGATKFFDFIGTRGSKGTSYSFDVATDRANRIPQMQNLWMKGCADTSAIGDPAFTSEACRAAVFVLGISNAVGLDYTDIAANSLVDYDKVVATWKANLSQTDLDFHLGNIPNRNPAEFEEIQLTTISQESDRIALWSKNLANNHTIDANLDPKTIAPESYSYFDQGEASTEALDLVFTYISGFLTPSERNALGKTPAEFNTRVVTNFTKIVQAGAAEKVFGNHPMIKGDALKAVFVGSGITNVGNSPFTTSCCKNSSKLPDIEIDEGDSNESSGLAVFDKHCFASCHGTFPDPLGFLKRSPGISDKEVWMKIVQNQGDQICVRLDWNLPKNVLAANKRMPRPPKMQALIDAEKATGESDRKEMMETYKDVLEEFANDPATLQTIGHTAQELRNYADTCKWTLYNGN